MRFFYQLTITWHLLPQLWQRAITASEVDGTDGSDGGSGGGVSGGGGGESIVVSRDGGAAWFNVGCFCFASFGKASITAGLVGISGIGGGGLVVITTGSGGGGGGGGSGGGAGDVSGGAPGGAVGKFATAFFTSLLADFSAPDAFSTG